MKMHYIVILSFTATALIQGCGSNVVIKQEAANTVTTGKTTISDINKFYDQVFDTQNKLAATLLAGNTSCNFGEYIIIYTGIPNESHQTDKSKHPLCMPREEQGKTEKVELIPFKRSSLKNSMDILEAFATYLDTISKHTLSPQTPIANTLGGVISELQAAQAKLEILDKNKNDTLTNSTAIGSLAEYIEKLQKNSKDAKSVRNIIATEGGKQEATLLELARNYDNILNRYSYSMNSSIANSLGKFYNENKNSKELDTFEKRQAFLITAFKQKQLSNDIAASPSLGSKAINLFVSAHKKLRDTISGNYTEEQKAILLEENKNQLIEGLRVLGNFAKFLMTIAS